MTAGFEKLIASSDAFLRLCRDAEAGRLSHAYLIDSADRLAGKLTMYALARFVLGGKARMADAFTLPEGDKETLTVADMSALIAGLNKRPSQGEHKFYLIDYAETMSALVQNKLLKSLEEPPSGVCVILNCGAVHKLLPTVVSRCARVEIRPFDLQSIARALTELYGENERVQLAAALSRGSITEAEAFMRDEKRHARFGIALDILANLKSSKDVLGAAARLAAQKDDCSETVGFFEVILRDARVLKAGLPDLVMLQSQEDGLKVIAEGFSETAIEKILPFLGKIRRRIQLNANKNSLLDELLFTIVEYRVKYRD